MTELWKELGPVKHEEPISRWLLTFTDLVSLLMGFFVLLFSTKEMDSSRWEALSGTFENSFSARHAVVYVRPDNQNNAAKKPIKGADDQLTYLDSLLQQRLGGDAVWTPVLKPVMVEGELRYALPPAWVEGDDSGALVGVAALTALAREVINWNNTVVVRLVRKEPSEAVLARLAALQQAVVAQGAGQVIPAVEWLAEGTTPEGLWLVVQHGGAR